MCLYSKWESDVKWPLMDVVMKGFWISGFFYEHEIPILLPSFLRGISISYK